jgi:hypothetical protein
MMERTPDTSNKKELQEIIKQFECPREVRCCKSEFKVLCKAKDIGLETYLKCLEEDPQSCQASVPFADGYFCDCPLRVRINKRLKI